MPQITLIRHGQSLWNKENLFTGWVDVDLSLEGEQEAKDAATILTKNKIFPTLVYTSLLKRAIRTAWIILDQLDVMATPMQKNWRLNERHYGGLQGKNKKEVMEQFGEEQVKLWRRSYDTPPPAGKKENLKYPHLCPDLKAAPLFESLKDTCERVIPFWQKNILPQVTRENILIVAHGNSIRGLLKHIFSIPDEEIVNLEIPTGRPLCCLLDKDGHGEKYYYLES